MRQWLTTLTLTIAIAVSGIQASAQPLTVWWLSFVANGNAQVPIRINPATGLVDSVNGVFVDSRFPSLSADGRQVVFQVGNGTTAQIWQAVWDATNRRWEVKPIFDDDGDNRASEDPIDGNDNDNDGRVDEDPPEFGIHPVISADGNHIAFASWDDDRDGAVDEDPLDGQDNDGDGKIDEDPPKSQIYVLDRLQNRIVPISFLWRDTNGDGMRDTFVPSNGNCVPVAISADGRIVVFLAQSPNALNIVDADGDGTPDPVNNPPSDPPSDWLVLIHDRDADGNGVYDEAGIGATRTFVGSMGNNGNPLPAASVSVSANGRIIAFATPDPDPNNPDNPDENWRVIVRDWQNGDQVEIPNAFAPALSDDGTYLAYLQPTAALNEPSPTYLQSKMNLVVQRIERDPNTGRLTLGPSLSLTDLTLPAQSGTADGSAGWGYSDWWGAVTIAVDPRNPNVNDPRNPNVVYAAFHAWSTELIELQNALLRDDDGDGRLDEDPINGRDDDGDGRVDEDPPVNFYQGVPNIFLARFDFGSNSVQLWRLLPPSSSPTPDWASRALPVSLERNGTIFRLPLAPSLLPAISFVNPDPNDPRLWRLFVAFQSLAPFDQQNDTNGLWDIYLADVLLP
jgi:hypothetical protein